MGRTREKLNAFNQELLIEIFGEMLWLLKMNNIVKLNLGRSQVFDDGSLYIGDLRLDHMGNYTCQDRLSNDVIQTHVLLVQSEQII